MSHRKIWLSAACILFLVGCGNTNNSSKTTLKTPELVLNSTNDGITWESIEGATAYEITVDEETETVSVPGYQFALEYGDYEVSIVAVDKNGNKSQAAVYNYETRVTRLGNLQFDGEKITWPGSDYYALEMSTDGEEYNVITDSFYTVEDSGLYYFRTVKGFRESGHVFFAQEIKRCLIVTKGATSPYILEDGSEPDDATLSENYRKLKYTSGWEVSAAYTTLDNNYEDYVDGSCVNFHTWYHDMYYMFEKKVNIGGSYNEFDFTVKSSASVTIVLSFQITHTFVVNGVDLNGVYVKYTLAPAPVMWTKYRVSLNDPNWKVNYNGTDYKFSDVAGLISAAGVKVENLADMFPFFDVFQFRIRAAYQDGGPSATTFFDDVKLVNSDITSTEIREITPDFTVQPNYAFQGTSSKGSVNFYDDTHARLRMTSPAAMEIQATYAIDNDILTVTSTASGKDFVATFTTTDGGVTLTLDTVTGSLAPYMQGITAEAISKMEDYEGFTSTGVGYDLDHDEEERSGLRGAYLCDAYVGGTAESPIGGKGWSLLSSNNSNYMYLDNENAHTGDNSMSIINNGLTNRFMQWQLHDGSGKGIRGKTFSIWAKGGDKADATLRVGVYYTQPVGPSNHSSDAARKLVDFTITKNSDWKEYTITLDTTKVYFGFSLLTLSNAANLGQESQYIHVDDVYIYNNFSPWAI